MSYVVKKKTAKQQPKKAPIQLHVLPQQYKKILESEIRIVGVMKHMNRRSPSPYY